MMAFIEVKDSRSLTMYIANYNFGLRKLYHKRYDDENKGKSCS
jgi:hypothetical protein